MQAFFEAYSSRDMKALHQVVADDAVWYFPGDHPYSGAKKGFDAIVEFFDAMSTMNMQAEQYVVGAKGEHLVEAQRTWCTDDDVDFEMEWCIHYTFADGKLATGRHFPADQLAVNRFFKERAKAHGSKSHSTKR
jgi:ketosteroid isomerase-like protein